MNLKSKNSDIQEAEETSSSRTQIVWFGVYLIVLNLVLLYLLVSIWPSQIPPSQEKVIIGLLATSFVFPVPTETLYLLIVALAGGLGSHIHLATSFIDYVGNRRFRRSWGWWYLLRPFVGMTLGVIVYFTIRAGLVTISFGGGTIETLNPYSMAAVAGLAGMFSKQATDKLREVFESLFTTKEPTQRGDRLKPDEEDDSNPTREEEE